MLWIVDIVPNEYDLPQNVGSPRHYFASVLQCWPRGRNELVGHGQLGATFKTHEAVLIAI